MPQPDVPYIEFQPDLRLRHFVECYWCIKASSRLQEYRQVLPDACSDIIFNFADPISYSEEGVISQNSFQSFYVGIQTKPILTRTVDKIDLFGVRFKNDGAWRFLKRPLHEFKNRVAALIELDETALDAKTDQLACLTMPERVKLIELALLKRLGNDTQNHPLTEFWNAHSLSLTSFCQKYGISERTLERKSLERVGVSPKMYQRIARFRKASELLPLRKGSLMEFAWGMGYYDHAHLTKEFRQFGHVLPSSLFN